MECGVEGWLWSWGLGDRSSFNFQLPAPNFQLLSLEGFFKDWEDLVFNQVHVVAVFVGLYERWLPVSATSWINGISWSLNIFLKSPNSLAFLAASLPMSALSGLSSMILWSFSAKSAGSLLLNNKPDTPSFICSLWHGILLATTGRPCHIDSITVLLHPSYLDGWTKTSKFPYSSKGVSEYPLNSQSTSSFSAIPSSS